MFIKTIHKSSIKTGGQLLLLVAAAVALLTWPQAVAGGVSRGLSICGTVIIPSLFPFLVLAGFLVRSGIGAAVGRKLEKPTRFLFGLPGCCAAGILVGFIGGYPAGGIATGELVERGDITRDEGRRMLRFCVNAGPAFIISAVGAGMLGNIRMGVVLFAAHILASIIIGIGSRLLDGRKSKRETNEVPVKTKVKKIPVSSAFVESVNAACRSMLYMCGFVILFAAVLSLCDASGITALAEYVISLPFALIGGDTQKLACLFPCILEVSCGTVEAAQTRELAPLLLGMALGWGGLSVHCQLAATLHGQQLLHKGFFLYRAIHAALGGLLSVFLCRVVPMPLETLSPSNNAVVSPFSMSVVASVALLFMCSMLLMVCAGRNSNGKVKISLEKGRKI